MCPSDKQQHSRLPVLCFRLFELLAVLSFITEIIRTKTPNWIQDLLLEAIADPSLLAGIAIGWVSAFLICALLLWKLAQKGG
jgi:hypothetical protein